MSVLLKDGKVLLTGGGKVAIDSACCCGGCCCVELIGTSVTGIVNICSDTVTLDPLPSISRKACDDIGCGTSDISFAGLTASNIQSGACPDASDMHVTFTISSIGWSGYDSTHLQVFATVRIDIMCDCGTSFAIDGSYSLHVLGTDWLNNEHVLTHTFPSPQGGLTWSLTVKFTRAQTGGCASCQTCGGNMTATFLGVGYGCIDMAWPMGIIVDEAGIDPGEHSVAWAANVDGGSFAMPCNSCNGPESVQVDASCSTETLLGQSSWTVVASDAGLQTFSAFGLGPIPLDVPILNQIGSGYVVLTCGGAWGGCCINASDGCSVDSDSTCWGCLVSPGGLPGGMGEEQCHMIASCYDCAGVFMGDGSGGCCPSPCEGGDPACGGFLCP